MSGHSKWSTIKRAKGAADAKRGQIFSRIGKEISLASKAGGGDVDMNPRLRGLLAKAKAANMPADNIDRAIKKGTGELPGLVYEQYVYEGYAPGGVAVIVEVTTDNKNRSASDVRSIFSKNGGNLAGAHAVSFMFNHCGHFLIGKESVSEEDLMDVVLDAGADDIKTHPEFYEVITPVSQYDTVANALEEKGITADSSELAYIAETIAPVTDEAVARQVQRLLDLLDENEDVQNVFSNAEIDESIQME